jgi:hypothetical protein
VVNAEGGNHDENIKNGFKMMKKFLEFGLLFDFYVYDV